MPSHMLLKVAGMSKVSGTLRTDKPTLVHMNQHMIVERVLPGEGGGTELAHVRLEAGMFLVVKDESVGRGELLVGTYLALVDQRSVSVDDHRFGRS